MSAANDTACVYSAAVMHERFTTAQYRFRYRIFGRFDACPVPTPEERSRFLP